MRVYHLFLAALMMTTGSINTITTKFADITCAKGTGSQNVQNCNDCVKGLSKECQVEANDERKWLQHTYCQLFNSSLYLKKPNVPMNGSDFGPQDFGPSKCDKSNFFATSGKNTGELMGTCAPICGDNNAHLFDHPFAQAFAMFVGEFLCLVVYKLLFYTNKKSLGDLGPQEFSPFVWAIPAFCDCCATSTMYIGLTLTYASSFQMLRGAVVIFTGIFSVILLKAKLVGYHWAGMFVVLMGLTCVGSAAFIGGGGSTGGAPNQVLGDLLIIGAQVVVAIQMVVEEKLMNKYRTPPLQAVGWEGVFGMCYMAIFCIIFYHTDGPRVGGKFENAFDAWAQFTNSGGIQLAITGTICSIALFNYSGLSVTKEMSATTRMVLDSLRTIIIWVFGLVAIDPNDGSTWESFDASGPGWLQIGGFVLLLTGSGLYNEKDIAGTFDATGKPLKEPLIYPLFRTIGLPFAKLPTNGYSASEASALLGKKAVNSSNVYEDD